jgi:DNA polymerase-3 subunit delta'
MTEKPGLAPYPWQTAAWQLLAEQLKQGRLPHALLLTGHAGTGKSHFARALAERLLCTAPVQDRACGNCKGCQLTKAGSHPDLLSIEPEEAGKAIKVDQVRQLKAFSSQTAQLNGYKVIILQPADALNINAANALLKDLEEPPPQTLFLLVTDQPDQVSATIRSRCNQLVSGTPDIAQARDWLANVINDSAAVELALKLADNAPLLALQLYQEDGLGQRKAIYRGLADIQQHKGSPCSVAQSWQAFDPLQVIQWLQVWVNDLVKTVMTGGGQPIKNQDLASFIQKTAGQVQLHSLYLYLDSLQAYRRALLSGHNPNKILLFETLLIDWSDCFKR